MEVRRGLNDTGIVHIFSLPDRKPLFDAENLTFSGVMQEDIQKVGKMKKELKSLEKEYNKKKKEYDKGKFRTPAEIYAEEQEEEVEMAHDYKDITVITGDAGTGKTTAVRQYEQESYAALAVYTYPDMPQIQVITKIARLLNIP